MKNETNIQQMSSAFFSLSFLVSEVNQRTEKMATYTDLFESEKINAYPNLFEIDMNNSTDTEKVPVELF